MMTTQGPAGTGSRERRGILGLWSQHSRHPYQRCSFWTASSPTLSRSLIAGGQEAHYLTDERVSYSGFPRNRLWDGTSMKNAYCQVVPGDTHERERGRWGRAEGGAERNAVGDAVVTEASADSRSSLEPGWSLGIVLN